MDQTEQNPKKSNRRTFLRYGGGALAAIALVLGIYGKREELSDLISGQEEVRILKTQTCFDYGPDNDRKKVTEAVAYAEYRGNVFLLREMQPKPMEGKDELIKRANIDTPYNTPLNRDLPEKASDLFAILHNQKLNKLKNISEDKTNIHSVKTLGPKIIYRDRSYLVPVATNYNSLDVIIQDKKC